MIWKTLGISPTDDIKEIKKAYTVLARKHNPEEHPEEFKKIFNAYKAACAYAKKHKSACESTDVPKTVRIIEPTSSYDFSVLEKAKELTSEQLFDIMKNLVSDPVRKNDPFIWRGLLSDSEVRNIISEKKFRKKAANFFKRTTFTPEAASAIASGFGKGSKAVHIYKDDIVISEEDLQKLALSYEASEHDDTLQKWRVLISDGTGKPVKSKPLMPSYAHSEQGFHIKVSDVIVCIIIAVIFIIAACAEKDKNAYPYEECSDYTDVSETFTIGEREFYIDKNGNLNEK